MVCANRPTISSYWSSLILAVDSELTDIPQNGFENGVLTVPFEDLKGIFDTVVNQILVLLTQQLEDVKKARPDVEKVSILLVGGFGSNEYLAKRVRETFRSSADIVQPSDS
jgi:tRNA A37 threonylcarbamoyltransferase TsaD